LRRGALGLVALVGLVAAGSFAFPTTAWAVPGGYGPSGGWGGGGSGTLGDVIVAKTIGPDGGTVTGWDGPTKITIVIPPGVLPTNELIEVTSSTPDCTACSGHNLIVGLAVTHVLHGQSQGAFSGAVKVYVTDQRIWTHSSVLTSQCVALSGAYVSDGFVVVTLYHDSTFAIVSPWSNSNNNGSSGYGHASRFGFFRPDL
jgi:hypothetical protein